MDVRWNSSTKERVWLPWEPLTVTRSTFKILVRLFETSVSRIHPFDRGIDEWHTEEGFRTAREAGLDG